MFKFAFNLYLGGMLAIFPTAYLASPASSDPVMRVITDLVTWPYLYMQFVL